MFPFTVWAPIILPVVLGGHHRKILPYDLNGPFKQVMMSLFRLAWSSKIRLPLLITVAFLALDVHLQMEINVFWEANNREIEGRENDERQPRRRQYGSQPHRPLVPSSLAPLAEAEELDDDDEDDDDSSTVSSLPSTVNASSTPVQSTRRYRFWENLRPSRPLDYDDEDEDEDIETSEEEESSLVCTMTPAASQSQR